MSFNLHFIEAIPVSPLSSSIVFPKNYLFEDVSLNLHLKLNRSKKHALKVRWNMCSYLSSYKYAKIWGSITSTWWQDLNCKPVSVSRTGLTLLIWDGGGGQFTGVSPTKQFLKIPILKPKCSLPPIQKIRCDALHTQCKIHIIYMLANSSRNDHSQMSKDGTFHPNSVKFAHVH